VTNSENDSPARQRQLVVGLDAMEWSLVQRWADEGKLPAFARLLREGARGELASTSAQLPDTVWACIYTGTNPAKFQKYFYVQYDPTTGDLRHVPDDAIRAKPFWEHLSEAGVRVGVVDVPKFRLSDSILGFQVTNWGAHATKTARASSPPGLLDEIDRRHGAHPVGDCDAVDDNPKALAGLRDRILEGVRIHGALFRDLLERESWDVFFASFSAPHCIGHHYWHWVDPTHPRHGEVDTHGLADSIERVYRAVDTELGKLLDAVGPETRVIVVAGHGMGPIYHASWNLPEMLELLGYAGKPARRAQGEGGAEGNADAGRDAKVNPWRIVKMVVPGKVQYAIKGVLPKRLQDELLFRWYAGGRNWKRHRAFAVPNNDSVGAIRVNVRGRDRHGMVEPGAEYEQVCRDIAQALEELVDPETGRKVVRRVTLTHEEFSGPYLDGLPDITVLWDQSFPWHSVHSPRLGTLRIKRQDSRAGSHTPRGFVLVSGPGIAPGGTIEGASLYDVAPTILDAAGVQAPADMDGRPFTAGVSTGAAA
jgi:predicted AlkP superfamily phosphohydrolase/phosphomutase